MGCLDETIFIDQHRLFQKVVYSRIKLSLYDWITKIDILGSFC